MKRERKCDKPRPAYGGKNCGGSGKEEKTCNTQACAGMFVREMLHFVHYYFDILFLVTYFISIISRNYLRCINEFII